MGLFGNPKVEGYVGPGPKDDPWKGFANGADDANGFKILSPGIAGSDVPVKVPLEVQTTKPIQDSDWNVVLLLHPSFEPPPFLKAFPVNQVAKEELAECWGPFTVGAVVREKADHGGTTVWEETKLELDLGNVPGGPSDFYTGRHSR